MRFTVVISTISVKGADVIASEIFAAKSAESAAIRVFRFDMENG